MIRSKNAFPLLLAAAATIVACIAVAGIASAQAREQQLSEEQRAQIEERLAAVRTRLNLTAEQEAQLQPILRTSFEKRTALLNAYGLTQEGGQRPSRQQLRALRGEMEQLREQTETQVDAVLDERQMAEFRRIQGEMREQVRARVRENRQ